MSDHIETCPDNHHCENGSKCVQNPYDEGSYYCDCDEVIWNVDYEGLFCEHKAEVYCTKPGNGFGKHWFCTNGGTCMEEVGKDLQWKCNCPDEYEGSYCQYVKGSKPAGYPFNNRSNPSKNPSPGRTEVGAVVGSLVAVFVVAAFTAALLYRRLQGQQERKIDGITGRDMDLEVDGSILKAAVRDINAEGKKPRKRPETGLSEAGLSYADENEAILEDDNSMVSFS